MSGKRGVPFSAGLVYCLRRVRKGFVLLVFAFWTGTALAAEPSFVVDLNLVKKMSEIDFPTSAKVISSSYTKSDSDIWKMKILMPASDYQEMMAEAPLNRVAWGKRGIPVRGNDPWWTPWDLKDPFFAHFRVAQGQVANMIYGIEGDQAVIFLQLLE